ncbi:hypothetical protein EMIT0P253_480008 [Pseudomonas sp. IT-P253]
MLITIRDLAFYLSYFSPEFFGFLYLGRG